MEQTESDQSGDVYLWKEGGGTRQRTCMNNPYTWTTVWGLTVGAGGGAMEEGKGRKIGTTVTE